MDKYGPYTLIDNFTYRGIEVDLFKTLKGRRHCKVQHAFDERKCKGCGAKLSPRTVYVIRIGDKPVDEDFDDIAHSVEFAKAYIDGIHDGPGDDQEDEPEPPSLPTKESDGAAPPPPPQGLPPGKPGDRAKILAMVKKLGWGRKLAAMARKEPPPKKP